MTKTDGAKVAVRPASSAIILRDAAAGMEVFMVVRHHQIDFASGAFVFPGGKVDPQDSAFVEASNLGVTANGPEAAYWVAAIRETFEEAGLLLARKRNETELVSANETHDLVVRHRDDVVKGDLPFSEMLLQYHLVPALDLLVHFAHWITPMTQPKRFDTHFFLVSAPVKQMGAHDGSEAVEGVWTAPRQALADASAGRRTMLPPTRLNLEKLAQDDNVAHAVQRARAATVVCVEPRVELVDGGRKLHLPIEAGYGVSELFVRSN